MSRETTWQKSKGCTFGAPAGTSESWSPATFKQPSAGPAWTFSLGTSDRREATLQATLKRAHWLATFETKRRELSPATVDAVTPELAQHLADRIRARVLSGDDDTRQDSALLADLASAKAPPPSTLSIPVKAPQEAATASPKRDPLEGITEAEAAALTALNAFIDQRAAQAHTRRNLAIVLPLVQREAKSLGITFDLDTPGVLEALPVCLAAYRKAWQELTARDAGGGGSDT